MVAADLQSISRNKTLKENKCETISLVLLILFSSEKASQQNYSYIKHYLACQILYLACKRKVSCSNTLMLSIASDTSLYLPNPKQQYVFEKVNH